MDALLCLRIFTYMILRSGKYKGMDSDEVQQYDAQYIWWIKENRPEMLKAIKTHKPKNVEMTDEEIEQRTSYKDVPKLSWAEAFF